MWDCSFFTSSVTIYIFTYIVVKRPKLCTNVIYLPEGKDLLKDCCNILLCYLMMPLLKHKTVVLIHYCTIHHCQSIHHLARLRKCRHPFKKEIAYTLLCLLWNVLLDPLHVIYKKVLSVFSELCSIFIKS